jgi:multidrug resistance efflux pump
MRRMILVPILVVVAIAAILGGIGYYIYDNYMYYRTDDAQVTGNIVSVSAPTAGVLTTLSVKQNDSVTAGQTIGTITPVGTGATATAINLTSPISGVVLMTSAVQGQAVAPGLTVVQVTDPNSLTVTAYVDESQMDNIKTTQDVDIHIDAYGDTTFTGKVQQIVQATAGTFSLIPNQDNTSGNFTKVGQRIPVVISLDGTGGKDIVPGMSVEVTIHLH